jgi:tetratricopeptide (TPR) repeat protein/nucleoside phosphorylase
MIDVSMEVALESRDEIDLLLITATRTETAAVLTVLSPISGQRAIARTHIENNTYHLGKLGPFGVVHLQCVMGTRDAGSATLATNEAARCWMPRAVIMLGIAWGNEKKGMRLGDVLVASSVQDIDHVRVGTSDTFRSPEAQAGPKLINRITNVDGWVFIGRDGIRSTQRIGLLLSGDKLIANADFRDKLLRRFERAIGGEMEAYGVAQACRALGIEWAVTKGVCDWGDEGKDDSWQSTAAAAAVSLCAAALRNPSALDGLEAPNVVASSVVGASGDAVPFQLPPLIDRFVGRQTEKSDLIRALVFESEAMILSMIRGMGGMGKSFLAAKVAREAYDQGRFPDGVIWHDTYDSAPALVMAHVLTSFNEPLSASDPARIREAYVEAMADRRVLIVLDNALSADQVKPLLLEDNSSAVLVTSRIRMPTLSSRACLSIDLRKMSRADGFELLQEHANIDEPDELTALEDVADLCGLLPLALSIAGALLSERELWPSVSSFRSQLKASRLNTLAIEDSENLDVRAVLLLSYDRMGPDLQSVFRALSVLGRSSFGSSALTYVLARDKNATIASLAKLIGRSVLERSALGQYVLHDLLRDLAIELLARDESPDVIEGYRIRSSAYWGKWHEALHFGSQASAFAKRGNAHRAIALYHKAQSLNAELGDRQGQASALGGLGAAHAKKGDAVKAIEFYDRAQALNGEIGDKRGQASALGGLAAAHAKKGDAVKAIEFYDRAQALNGEIGDKRGQASALGGLAAAHAKKGDAVKAIEFYEKGLALSVEIGDKRGQASALGGLGAAHAKKGDAVRAIEFYERGLTLSVEIGDKHGQASALGGLGAAHAKKGDAVKAIEFYEKGLTLSVEIGDKHGQASALGGLAAAHAKKGDAVKAIEFYEKGLTLSVEIGDKHGQASALGGIAAAHAKKGDAVKAIEFYDRAQMLNGEIRDKHGQASALGGIAGAYAKKGDTVRAIKFYEKGLALRVEIGDKHGQASTLCGIATAHAKKGDANKAIEFYEKGLALSVEIGDKRGQASALGGIAAAHAKKGDAHKAIEFYDRAQALNGEIGDKRGQASALGGLAAAHAKKGDAHKAIEFYDRAQALNGEIGDKRGQASALGGMAAVHARSKHPKRAIELYLRALELNEQVGNRPFIGTTLRQLSRLANTVGDQELKRWCEERLKRH